MIDARIFCARPARRAVATADLAGHDRRPERVFRAPVLAPEHSAFDFAEEGITCTQDT